jgi:2-polyprenyl-6-methoxyphenol hydroxylase-like FAD-dependent oxidoreductase
MEEFPILVAGGGIAGLAAALGLARQGKAVRLFEQAEAFAEAGAGLQMSPNGVRALMALGAWEHVEASCVVPSGIHVRDGRSGRLLQRIQLGKGFEQQFGAPYRVCHRADLLAGLLAAARQQPMIELNTGQAVLGPADSGLRLANGQEIAGVAVVAADGIRSQLRASVCGDVAPQFRGAALYRSLLPLSQLPPQTVADCVTLWLCPGAHVVHYPVSNWRNFNILVAADGAELEGGWQSPAERQDVLGHFADLAPALVDLLAAAPSWRRWAGADLPPLARWSAGRTVLTGDAAHATLPFLAQGAMMALEDAVVLGQEMGRRTDLTEAFQHYERRRKPRTARVQHQSRGMSSAYHAAGFKADARNLVLRLAGPSFALNRLSWIYRWTPDDGG